jgi:transmembrane sensor
MNNEQTEEIASQWLVKQLSGVWTAVDQTEFATWLEAGTVNRVTYIRLAAAWKRLARITALGAGVTPGLIPARGSWGDAYFSKITLSDTESAPTLCDNLEGFGIEQPSIANREPSGVIRVHRRWLRRRSFAAAAAVILMIVIGGIYPYFRNMLSQDRYSTPVGGLGVVHLIDGSQVTLNTNTTLHVVMTKEQRRIDLEKGEAFFVVAHDSARPFVVYAGNKRVMAVGTQFSVRRESDDVQVVVTEGRVGLATTPAQVLRFLDARGESVPRTPGEGTTYPPVTLLRAGAVARTINTDVLVHQEAVAESEALLSWRNGYVSFRDATLADAVNEFNRYNARKMVIEDPEIASIHIGGNFRDTNTDAFLWLLQNGFPIRVVQDQDKIVLRAR